MKTLLSDKEYSVLREKLTKAGAETGHTPIHDDSMGVDHYLCSCTWESCLFVEGEKIAFSSWASHVVKHIDGKHPKLVKEAKDWFG